MCCFILNVLLYQIMNERVNERVNELMNEKKIKYEISKPCLSFLYTDWINIKNIQMYVTQVYGVEGCHIHQD